MRVKDKDKQRRMSRDEREARRKFINKRKACPHTKRKPLGDGRMKCTCGMIIADTARY